MAALNATTEQQRNAMFAETFQTLGQVMHLVADLASVPHARDDGHPFARTFEDFVNEHPELITGFRGFDKSILTQPTGDSVATLPIARLWDTNSYNGTNPPGDLDQQIGLAEFTNANFFSRDTIKSTAFADPELPLPALNRLVPGQISPDPRTGRRARYLSKNGDGVQVTHMVRVNLFAEFLSNLSLQTYQLDERVYEDYARYLLPRAIGYSAGILDYFFRGKIKIEAPKRYVYSLAQYVEGNAGFFTKMRFKVSNDTDYPSTTENTDGAGQMWAVVRYRTAVGGKDLIVDPSAGLSEPKYAVSAPVSATLTRALTPQEAQEVIFDFTGSPIPTNSADIFLMVVWQGKLGMENGAVMVGGKDLFEPAPLDFGDGSDYDCHKANLYHVADLTAYPPYNPPTQTQRDIDSPTDPNQKDGIQDIFGPFFTNEQYIKAYDLSKPTTASPNNFDFTVLEHQATLSGPQYSRFMLLQDQSVYAFSLRVGSFFDLPTQITSSGGLFGSSLAGIFNDHVVDAAGNRIRRVTPNLVYRGVTTFHIFIFVVGGPPRFEPCLAASYPYKPSFTKIDGELAPELPE